MHKRRIEKKTTNNSFSSPSAQLWKHMLPHNERKWVGPIITLIWGPKWVDYIPRGPLHETMRCLWLTCYQASRCWEAVLASCPRLLIRSEVWRSLRENRSGTDLAVGGKPDYIGAERLHLLLLRVFAMGFQGKVQPKMKMCYVKHNVPAALQFQKEQIKHHISSSYDLCTVQFSSFV